MRDIPPRPTHLPQLSTLDVVFRAPPTAAFHLECRQWGVAWGSKLPPATTKDSGGGKKKKLEAAGRGGALCRGIGSPKSQERGEAAILRHRLVRRGLSWLKSAGGTAVTTTVAIRLRLTKGLLGDSAGGKGVRLNSVDLSSKTRAFTQDHVQRR